MIMHWASRHRVAVQAALATHMFTAIWAFAALTGILQTLKIGVNELHDYVVLTL